VVSESKASTAAISAVFRPILAGQGVRRKARKPARSSSFFSSVVQHLQAKGEIHLAFWLRTCYAKYQGTRRDTYQLGPN